MDPLARRRSVRQEPDSVDDELEKAMQAADGKSSSTVAGSSGAGRGRKTPKKSKDGEGNIPKLVPPDPSLSTARDASESEEIAQPLQPSGSEAAQESEDMGSPESVAAHPFWSDKAKMEVALAKARPQALDVEALRFANDGESRERPVDLEERAQQKKEVRVEEEYLEPPYDSPQRESSSREEDMPPLESIGKKGNEGGKQSLSARQSRVVHSSESADRSGIVQSWPDHGRVGEQLEDQALEIAQLRSLVDHLQGTLSQVEESRSFTSSSNQGFEQQQSRAGFSGVNRASLELASLEYLQNEELRPLNMPRLSPRPQPPVGPVSGAWPPLLPPRPPSSPVQQSRNPPPPKPISPPPMLVSMNPSRSLPEVYPMSSKASSDPFKEVVMIHGHPHRWIRIGDKLGLEPVTIHNRERSPSPPPPVSTPPPSPPPYRSATEGWMSSYPAPGEPNSQALVLYSEGHDLSSQALGDQDGSGSGVHSYQSAESGGVKAVLEAYPKSFVTNSPSVGGVGNSELRPHEPYTLDKQSILYHLDKVRRGQMTLDQLTVLIGAPCTGTQGSTAPPSGLPGTGEVGPGAQHLGMQREAKVGPTAAHSGLEGLHAERANLQGLGAMPKGMLGTGAAHAGMQGTGAQHVNMPGAGAVCAGVQGLGATSSLMQGLSAQQIDSPGLNAVMPGVLQAGAVSQVPAMPSSNSGGLGVLAGSTAGVSRVGSGGPSACRLGL